MDATSPLYTAYQRQNPARPVDWRWQHAQAIVASGRHVCRRDDDATRRAVAYLRALSHCGRESQLDRLASRFPDVHAARLLYDEGGSLKAIVEARILARQPDADIAELAAVPVSVVTMFEAFFFCVRDRLNTPDWISSTVIGDGLWAGFTRHERDKVWRMFGYCGGSLVLDIVLAVTQGMPLPASVRAPSGQDEHAYRMRLRLSTQIAVASRMIHSPADGDMVRRLVLARRRLDRVLLGKPDTSESVLDAMLAFLSRRRPLCPRVPADTEPLRRVRDSQRTQVGVASGPPDLELAGIRDLVGQIVPHQSATREHGSTALPATSVLGHSKLANVNNEVQRPGEVGSCEHRPLGSGPERQSSEGGTG